MIRRMTIPREPPIPPPPPPGTASPHRVPRSERSSVLLLRWSLPGAREFLHEVRRTLYDSLHKDQTAPRQGETPIITQRQVRVKTSATGRCVRSRLAESPSWEPSGER